jgi:ActR/RegA family two-component response regulator
MEAEWSDVDEMLQRLANTFVEHGWPFQRAMDVWGKALVYAALKQSQQGNREQNQCKAAERLGIHRNTLARHM